MFSLIFSQVTDEESNCEEAVNINIDTINNVIVVNFEIDDGEGRIHQDNTIKIFQDDTILVDLCEAFESGGIGSLLDEYITELINK